MWFAGVGVNRIQLSVTLLSWILYFIYNILYCCSGFDFIAISFGRLDPLSFFLSYCSIFWTHGPPESKNIPTLLLDLSSSLALTIGVNPDCKK